MKIVNFLETQQDALTEQEATALFDSNGAANNAIASHLSAQNPHQITPTLIGAAAASHTHSYLSFSDNNYPYLVDFEFHGTPKFSIPLGLHYYAGLILEIRGGAHVGGVGNIGFIIQKYISNISNPNSFTIGNISQALFGQAAFLSNFISINVEANILTITINNGADGRFTLLISGSGVNGASSSKPG